MRLIGGILMSLFLAIFLVGCNHQNDAPKTHPKVHTKVKVPKYQTGIPKRLQGTYYRTEIEKNHNIDDEFWTLQIQKQYILLKRAGEEAEVDWKQVKTRIVNDSTYVIYDGFRYLKLVCLANDKLNMSVDTFASDGDALNDKRMQTFTKNKPTGYFGISSQDLIRHIYTSNSGIERYYSFNDSRYGSNLFQVDANGNLKEIANYETLGAKNNGYILGQRNSDEETVLIPLANGQIKDPKTGEVFSRYPKGEYQLQLDIRQKFGLGPMPEPKYTPAPTQPAKDNTAQKTYDFADDQDDDYYDTYDDFGLNDGD